MSPAGRDARAQDICLLATALNSRFSWSTVRFEPAPESTWELLGVATCDEQSAEIRLSFQHVPFIGMLLMAAQLVVAARRQLAL
jgi:hypothetical protein